MKNGVVVACNTPEDLTIALVAIGRSDDALSIQQPTTKRNGRSRRPSAAGTAAATVESPGARWTGPLAKKLLDEASESAGEMVRVAVSLGRAMQCGHLAKELGTRAGALGPMIGKLCRDAQAIAPYLPAPMQTSGRPGHKELVFDVSFLEAAKEAIT